MVKTLSKMISLIIQIRAIVTETGSKIRNRIKNCLISLQMARNVTSSTGISLICLTAEKNATEEIKRTSMAQLKVVNNRTS